MSSNEEVLVKLVEKLEKDLHSKDVYKILVTIRTKHMDKNDVLIQNGLVPKLAHHLKRPNSKVVDVALSILGNLLLNEVARKQIRPHIKVVTSILTTINEESILARTCRVLANIAQDSENARLLKSQNLLIVLVKTLNELKNPKAKASIVRAVRVLGALEKPENLLTSNALASVSLLLTSAKDGEDDELLKAVTKCLAKLSSHCDQFKALQIQGEGQGFQKLVECCRHENSSIWEPALATLVNLSFVESLRPNLGNAGVIWTFIVKANESGALTQSDFFRTINALCLYCRESVNRMKIRDAGGLRLFVSILQDPEKDEAVKNKIIKSLMQFSYDDMSLKVLQHVGLVPALVKMLEEYNDKSFVTHSCEEFICDQEQQDQEDQIAVSEVEEFEKVEEKTVNEDFESMQDQADDEESNEASERGGSHRPSVEEREYRINSPSYREVQTEVEEFARIRSSLPGTSWMMPSPSGSAGHGLSPLYSRSPSASPTRSISPTPSYSASLSSAASSPLRGTDEPCSYSPIETFSDGDDDDAEEAPSPATVKNPLATSPSSSMSMPSKKPKMSPAYVSNVYQPMYMYLPSFKRSLSTSSNSVTKVEESSPQQISIILQILSRLAQAEMPHENLCSLRTVQALIKYLCNTKKPSKRAGRILIRLSKNLYCLMPVVNQRTLSWLKPQLEARPTMKDSPCSECIDLQTLGMDLVQNFSLLAETGYAEGVLCHTLLKGLQSDRLSVSIGVPLLVRPRKLLINILINHEGLEVLLDIIEHLGSDDEQLFFDAIYSLSTLSAHIGIAAPNLKFSPIEQSKCSFQDDHDQNANLRIVVDDGQILDVNRSVLVNASGVFDAMLSGQFIESNLSEVRIKCTSFRSLQSLVHHLYGCNWCPTMMNASPQVLLELTSLTDKYLLTEFNQSVFHEIVRRCGRMDQVVDIYQESLLKEYLVPGAEEKQLNVCAILQLLVGQMELKERGQVFRQLLTSKLSADFLEDVKQCVREKLQPIQK